MEIIEKHIQVNDYVTKSNLPYSKNLSKEIDEYCKVNNIKYINYFYHEELVKNK